MNIKLKKVNLESCCFFDIETAAKNKELIKGTREYDLFAWKNRDRTTNEVLGEKEIKELYKKEAALRLGYNQIVSIGVGFVNKGVVRIKSIEGTEEEIIKEFLTYTNKFEYLVSFNGIAFDMPMIIGNGNRYFDVCSYVPDKFNTSQKKVWDLKAHIDLMDVVRGTHYANVSFDEACYMYDVDSPKTDISGADVNRVFWEEGVKRISQYAKQDVFALINLFQALVHKERFESFTDVSSVPEKEQTFLQKLYAQNNFSENLMQELDILIGKKKLTKKDKENLFTILRAVYVRCDFENQDQDSKVVIKEKEEEINEYIKSLK